jgi:hypothetical protein
MYMKSGDGFILVFSLCSMESVSELQNVSSVFLAPPPPLAVAELASSPDSGTDQPRQGNTSWQGMVLSLAHLAASLTLALLPRPLSPSRLGDLSHPRRLRLIRLLRLFTSPLLFALDNTARPPRPRRQQMRPRPGAASPSRSGRRSLPSMGRRTLLRNERAERDQHPRVFRGHLSADDQGGQ